ncbi:MAG: YveK family protein [Limisphaerales bacterium]
MNESASARSRIAPAISIFFTVFIFVFTLACGASIIITAISTKSYESTARIKVDYKGAEGKQTRVGEETYDPVLAKTEAEVIKSERIMRKVVGELNLNVVWGKKYSNGETLKTWESMEFLKRRTDIRPVLNTTLIQIRAFDENPEDAATIANTIVKVYSNYAATNSDGLHMQIVESAYAEEFPVRPNKTLNVFLGALVGIFLGGGLGMVSALIFFFKNRKSTETSAL